MGLSFGVKILNHRKQGLSFGVKTPFYGGNYIVRINRKLGLSFGVKLHLDPDYLHSPLGLSFGVKFLHHRKKG